MAGSPGSDFYRDCFQRAQKEYDARIYESCGSAVINRRFADWQRITEAYPHLTFERIPDHLIFPFSVYPDLPHAEMVTRLFSEDMRSRIPTDTIGLHWYGNSPAAHEAVESTTATNITSRDNTVCNLIRGMVSDA